MRWPRPAKRMLRAILHWHDGLLLGWFSRRWARRFLRNYRDLEGDLQRLRRDRLWFEARVYDAWWDGLDQLDVLWLVVHEETSAFHERFQRRGLRECPNLFHAQRLLMARASRVTAEIATLLRGGHAEGAFARWRTLHEIAVTMNFLLGHDDEMSRRYLKHDMATAAAAITGFNRAAVAAGDPAIPADIYDGAREGRAIYREHFGDRYDEPYGWALPAFPKMAEVRADGRKGPPVTFADIEREAEQAHNRPFFRWASEQVHAGPGALRRGSISDLQDGHMRLLTTPLGNDLLAAGSSTATSFTNAALCMLTLFPSLRSEAAKSFIEDRCDEATDAWARAAATRSGGDLDEEGRA